MGKLMMRVEATKWRTIAIVALLCLGVAWAIMDAATTTKNISGKGPISFAVTAYAVDSTSAEEWMEWKMPYAVRLYGISCYMESEEVADNAFNFDLKEGGTSVLNEVLNCATAATPCSIDLLAADNSDGTYISDPAIADEATMTAFFDCDGTSCLVNGITCYVWGWKQ